MKLIITIDLDNDAFLPNPRPEISRILRELAIKYDNPTIHSMVIKDINGNTTGKIELSHK